MLTRDELLEKASVPLREEVPVPLWGGTVLLQGMSAVERDAFDAETYRDPNADIGDWRANFRARLCVRCVVDAEGNRILTDSDAERLGKAPGAVVDRLFEVGRRLSGLTEKDVEELEKNLPSGQSGDSSSGSASS